MKKMFHRIGAMALVFMMALTLFVTPAFAAGNTVDTGLGGSRSLTIKNVSAGATYNFYKLLDLQAGLSEAKDSVVSYRYTIPAGDNAAKIAEAVRTAMGTEGIEYDGTMGFQVNTDTVLFLKPELVKGADESDEAFGERQKNQNDNEALLMFKFADALRDAIVAEGSGITSNFTHKLSDDVQTGNNVVFTGLTDGYWMVTTDAGVRSIVFTDPSESNGNMEMDNKNPAPTLTKEVWDGNGSADASGKQIFMVCNAGDQCDAYDADTTKDGHIWVKDGNVVAAGTEGAVRAHVGSYKTDNDIGVNTGATFRLTVDAKSGARHIRIVDTLDKGLRYDGIQSVVFFPRGDREVWTGDGENKVLSDKITLVKDQDYVVSDASDSNGKTVLTIRFLPGFLDPENVNPDGQYNVYVGDPATIADDGGTIEVIYDAKLVLDESSYDVKEFLNSAVLEYSGDLGNDPGSDWIPGNRQETKTYTYDLDLLKHVKDDEATFLPGAKFAVYAVTFDSNAYTYKDGKVDVSATYTNKLTTFDAWTGMDNRPDWYEQNDDDHPVKFVDGHGLMYFKRIDAGNDTDPAVYVPVVYDDGDTFGTDWTYEIETPASGQVQIKGMDSGLYAIGELEAPAGYNKLDKSVRTVIGSTMTDSRGDKFMPSKDDPTKFEKVDGGVVKIANASGLVMPSTGGIGTTVFYVVGFALVAGAAVLLVVKKKASGKE